MNTTGSPVDIRTNVPFLLGGLGVGLGTRCWGWGWVQDVGGGDGYKMLGVGLGTRVWGWGWVQDVGGGAGYKMSTNFRFKKKALTVFRAPAGFLAQTSASSEL